MEENAKKMEEILAKLRERYKHVDSLMVSTKEMEDAVTRNDMESLELVLAMRRNAMERIDQIHKEMVSVVEGLPQADKDKINGILHRGEAPGGFDDPLMGEIFDATRSTAQLLQRVIDLDGAINKRFQKEREAGERGEKAAPKGFSASG